MINTQPVKVKILYVQFSLIKKTVQLLFKYMTMEHRSLYTSVRAYATQCCCHFLLFFIKAKILVRFLLVGGNRYYHGSCVKLKWYNKLSKNGGYLYF